MNTTSRRRTGATLKFMGWAITFLVVILNADPSAKESVNRPGVENSAALVQDLTDAGYYCWNSAAPDNYKATVVVMAKSGQGPAVYPNSHAVDRAVDQVVFGNDHGLTVYWFCGLPGTPFGNTDANL